MYRTIKPHLQQKRQFHLILIFNLMLIIPFILWIDNPFKFSREKKLTFWMFFSLIQKMNWIFLLFYEDFKNIKVSYFLCSTDIKSININAHSILHSSILFVVSKNSILPIFWILVQKFDHQLEKCRFDFLFQSSELIKIKKRLD